MSTRTHRVIEIVVFTVLVYAATTALPIYQPPTGGYFNLGESMIYVAALTTSPLVAGIAGGVGAALADLTTGYAIFAPGTLVIKFIEGFVAGFFVRKLKSIHGAVKALITGGVYSIILVSVYATLGGVYLGPSTLMIPGTSFVIELPSPYVEVALAVWIALGIALASLVIIALTKSYVSSGEVYGLAIGGALMVLGYYLYEYFISNPLTGREPAAAVLEIPVNIGQVIVGISIAIPVVSWLRRAGYIK